MKVRGFEGGFWGPGGFWGELGAMWGKFWGGFEGGSMGFHGVSWGFRSHFGGVRDLGWIFGVMLRDFGGGSLIFGVIWGHCWDSMESVGCWGSVLWGLGSAVGFGGGSEGFWGSVVWD